MPQWVVDVSNVNPADGPMWATVAHDHRYVGVICKGTEDEHFRDWTLASTRAKARAVGVVFGSYFFLRPRDGGAAQAAAYLAYAKPKPGEIQPIIDTEVTDGHSFAEVAACVDDAATALEKAGYAPIIYGSSWWLKQLYAERPHLLRLRVWQADYNAFLHRIPGVRAVLWQFTDHAVVGKGRFDESHLLVRDIHTLTIPPKRKPKTPVQAPKKRPAGTPAEARWLGSMIAVLRSWTLGAHALVTRTAKTKR